jgi:hypothetical protein
MGRSTEVIGSGSIPEELGKERTSFPEMTGEGWVRWVSIHGLVS